MLDIVDAESTEIGAESIGASTRLAPSVRAPELSSSCFVLTSGEASVVLVT